MTLIFMDKNKTAYKILQQLADGHFHSGQALGKQFGITRSGVWKAIQQLENVGVDIHAITGKGYRLPHRIDLLDAATIQSHLSPSTQTELDDLIVLSSTASTNDYLQKRISATEKKIACFSEHQTAGRGRRGRTWVGGYASSLCLSLLWPFDKDPHELMGLSLVSAIAVLRSLNAYGVKDLTLKWPNDILWQQKKLAGILVDLIAEPHSQCNTIIGVGLNTYIPTALSQHITQPWTDLAKITEQPVKRNQLASLLLNQLIASIHQFEHEGIRPFLEEWQRYDTLRGKKITVNTVTAPIVGIMQGISEQGALLVEVEHGEIKHFLSGDVSLNL